MEATTLTRPKHIPSRQTGKDRAYHDAWKRFLQVSARLGTLWKTKKTSAQILREVRNR